MKGSRSDSTTEPHWTCQQRASRFRVPPRWARSHNRHDSRRSIGLGWQQALRSTLTQHTRDITSSSAPPTRRHTATTPRSRLLSTQRLRHTSSGSTNYDQATPRAHLQAPGRSGEPSRAAHYLGIFLSCYFWHLFFYSLQARWGEPPGVRNFEHCLMQNSGTFSEIVVQN